MRRKFEELRENLDEFVEQTEYPVLVVGCLADELAYVLKFLQGLDDKHTESYFLVFGENFETPGQYLDAVTGALSMQVDAAAAVRMNERRDGVTDCSCGCAGRRVSDMRRTSWTIAGTGPDRISFPDVGR